MKFALVTILLTLSNTADAAVRQTLSKKLNFIRGVYKAKKGSHPDCVSGKFELLNGNGKAFHLTAAGSILASNVHTSKLKSKDETCTVQYQTKIIKKGFVNTELVECVKSKTFYRKAVKFQRNGRLGLDYSVRTQGAKKGKAKSLKCRFTLVKKY